MVSIKTDGIHGLMEGLKTKKLVCFGAGRHFDTVMWLYESFGLGQYVEYIVDSSASLQGTYKVFEGKSYEIISLPAFLGRVDVKSTLLLVTSHMYCMEIVSRLDEEACLEGLAVYVGSFLSEVTAPLAPCKIGRTGIRRIPRVIHYCWFGGGDIPEEYRRYMETWRRCCPGYEIRRWDESNFDVHGNRYMRQAYEKKKWAFVSDYARLAIIYGHGGIYLDCDVELVKNLDGLLSDRMFCGFEDQNHINLGLGFGAVKGHPYLKALMEYYDRLDFLKADGSMNLMPCPAYQTMAIRQFGVEAQNSYQKTDEVTVYPTEFFSPVSVWGTGGATANTCAVHHFGASWQTEEEREKTRDMYMAYQNRLSGGNGLDRPAWPGCYAGRKENGIDKGAK